MRRTPIVPTFACPLGLLVATCVARYVAVAGTKAREYFVNGPPSRGQSPEQTVTHFLAAIRTLLQMATMSSFEPDDAQLLSLLLSSSDGGGSGNGEDVTSEIAERLSGGGGDASNNNNGGGLAGRILSDFASASSASSSQSGSNAKWWDGLTASVEGLGLSPPTLVSTPPASSSSTGSAASSNNANEDQQPAAFQTEAGRAHLAAVRGLLDVDEKRAVGLTLATLRMLAERHDRDAAATSPNNGSNTNGAGS